MMNHMISAITRLAQSTPAESSDLDLVFRPMEFLKNLGYIGMGMLGIFIVIAAIVGVSVLLNTVTSGIGKNKDKDDE